MHAFSRKRANARRPNGSVSPFEAMEIGMNEVGEADPEDKMRVTVVCCDAGSRRSGAAASGGAVARLAIAAVCGNRVDCLTVHQRSVPRRRGAARR